MAISEYDLEPFNDEEPDWGRFVRDLRAEMAGGTDLLGALDERAERYGRFQRPTAARLPDAHVVVDNESSATDTILEIHAVDSAGVLFRIACALADAGLDIRHAKISTLGIEAIDTFYVVDEAGRRLDDPARLDAVTASIMSAIDPSASDADQGTATVE